MSDTLLDAVFGKFKKKPKNKKNKKLAKKRKPRRKQINAADEEFVAHVAYGPSVEAEDMYEIDRPMFTQEQVDAMLDGVSERPSRRRGRRGAG